MSSPHIVIIGAGPTGLGAGYRLWELGYDNWKILESSSVPGGLSGSVTDRAGFSWDYGGHVLFPTFGRIKSLLARLGDDFFHCIKRKAFVRLSTELIPYPVQLHLDCLKERLGWLLPQKEKIIPSSLSRSKNFKDWLLDSFGPELCGLFFFPYNQKVWGFALDKMSTSWVKDRVTPPGTARTETGWGPNNTFLYPKKGGMSAVFKKIAALFKDHVLYNSQVTRIDPTSKTIYTTHGRKFKFDVLISTIPLPELVKMIGKEVPEIVREAAERLCWNSCTVSGAGFSVPTSDRFSWIYFPEEKYPFHRVTALSSYSKAVLPEQDNQRFSSFMCETTEQWKGRPGKETVLEGIKAANLLTENGTFGRLVSFTRLYVPYAYPIPTLERDRALDTIQGFLTQNSIFSRGRFGGWKYECGNMDHSLMQGIEVVDRILFDKKERVYWGY